MNETTQTTEAGTMAANQLQSILKHLESADNIASEIGANEIRAILKGVMGAMLSGEFAQQALYNIAQSTAVAVERNLSILKKGA